MTGVIAGMGIIILIVIAAAFAYAAFVANPISIGHCRFYMEGRTGNTSLGSIFSAFGSGRYLATVKTAFLVTLRVFLWSLLFVIPG